MYSSKLKTTFDARVNIGSSLGGPAATAGLYGREIIASSSTLCCRENSLVSCSYNVSGLFTLFYFFDQLQHPFSALFSKIDSALK